MISDQIKIKTLIRLQQGEELDTVIDDTDLHPAIIKSWKDALDRQDKELLDFISNHKQFYPTQVEVLLPTEMSDEEFSKKIEMMVNAIVIDSEITPKEDLISHKGLDLKLTVLSKAVDVRAKLKGKTEDTRTGTLLEAAQAIQEMEANDE